MRWQFMHDWRGSFQHVVDCLYIGGWLRDWWREIWRWVFHGVPVVVLIRDVLHRPVIQRYVVLAVAPFDPVAILPRHG
jgi:hypothetical protein